MDDITTLCLLAVFILVGFALMSRMMGRMGGRNYPGSSGGYPQQPRGPYRPEVDDPDIRSGGSIGRPADPGSSRTSSSGSPPGRRGGGLFPSRGGSSQSSGGRADDPNVRSRGGFGRRK